jgi:photosystem II stability/assembly factor-like uncharacterized protein
MLRRAEPGPLLLQGTGSIAIMGQVPLSRASTKLDQRISPSLMNRISHRIVPCGIIRIPLLFLLLACISTASIHAQDFWRPTSGPYGARINSVAISPTGAIFAGTAAGIYRSLDSGKQWEKSGEGIIGVSHVAINASGDIFVSASATVARSNDNGTTWQRIDSLGRAHVHAIIIARDGHLAALHGFKDPGISYSSDNGETWTNTAYKQNTYLNTSWMTFGPNGDRFVAGSEFVTSGFPWASFLHHIPAVGNRRELPVSPDRTISQMVVTSGGVLYTLEGGGVHISRGDYTSWNHYEFPTGATALAIETNDNVYAGTDGNGVFRTTDGGSTWVAVEGGSRVGRVVSLAVRGRLIVAGTLAGLFVATDGATWERADVGIPARIQCLGVAPDGAAFAGTAEGEIFKTVDNGNRWTRVATDLNSLGLGIFSLCCDRDGRVIASTARGFFRSTDNGETWNKVVNGLPNIYPADAERVSPAFAVGTAGELFAALYSNLVHRSTDGGASWSAFGQGVNTNTDRMRSIAIAPNGTLLLGTDANKRGALRSTDGGATWSTTTNGTDPAYVELVGADRRGNLFASTRGVPSKLYRSTDNGESWVLSHTLTTGQSYRGFVANRRNHLFIGTSRTGADGVLRSTDGEHWETVNSGLLTPFVDDLAIDSAGYALAATWDGVFRTSESTSSVTTERISSTGALAIDRIHPLPANGTATIALTLPHAGTAALAVYDATGQEVARIEERMMEAGDHEIAIDLARLPNGLYLCRLELDGMVATAPMVVAR